MPRQFVSVPPRFLAWQQNCFYSPPSKLHILRLRGSNEPLVLDENEVKEMLNKKHPNSRFISTHFAASNRNYKTLRYIIELGANVDALDQVRQTPLMKALRYKPLDDDAKRNGSRNNRPQFGGAPSKRSARFVHSVRCILKL